MRVSLYLYTVAGKSAADHDQFLANIEEQVDLAQKLGYSGIWMPEHHVAASFFPPPFQFLTWLSARYAKLTIGTAIAIAPLYHPLHLAEAIGTLHWLSGGRARIAFGSGFRAAEFGAFGANRERRFSTSEEIVSTVRSLLEGEEVSFEFNGWRGTNCSTRIALQKGRPPLLWGVKGMVGAEAGTRFADGLLPSMLEGFARQTEILDKFDDMRGERAEIRPVSFDAVVAENPRQAAQRAVTRLGAEYSSFRHQRSINPAIDAFARHPEGQVEALKKISFIGTTEDLKGLLQRLQEAGATDAIIRLQQAATPQEEVLDAINAVGSILAEQEEVSRA